MLGRITTVSYLARDCGLRSFCTATKGLEVTLSDVGGSPVEEAVDERAKCVKLTFIAEFFCLSRASVSYNIVLVLLLFKPL